MTRLAVLADIHGNLPALEVVMNDMKTYAPDHVIVAGDVINWGPFSAEVTQIIMENHWTVIRGNNEYYLLNAEPPRRPANWEHYTMLGWLREQMTAWHHVIAGWADDTVLLYPDAPDIHLCHAIPGDCWKGIYTEPFTPDEQVRGWLQPARAKTVICGHTHLALERHVDDYQIINPGSVGVPLDGEVSASYMIIDGDASGWHVTAQRRLPFTLDRLLTRWEEQRFVEIGGAPAQMVIEEFKQARVMVHSFNTWRRHTHPEKDESLTLAAEFLNGDVDHYAPAPYRFR